jgi:hypothetical protein
MQIQATFNSRDLQDRLFLLAKEARVSQSAVLKEEARFIVQEVMKKTPPSTYAQGRKAVSRDIGKVYTSVGAVLKNAKNMSFEGKEQWRAALTRASRLNDENAMRELLTRPVKGVETVKVRPYTRNGVSVAGYTQARPFSGPALSMIGGSTQIGGALNPNLHTSRRNAYGQISGGKMLSQVVTNNKELNDYRKKIQERVGWHMAGWIPLAKLVGAKVDKWVEKTRLGAVSGTASANFTRGGRAFVLGTNFDVKIPGYQRIIDSVMAHRIKIAQRKLDRLIKGKAVNLGFTRIAAR